MEEIEMNTDLLSARTFFRDVQNINSGLSSKEKIAMLSAIPQYLIKADASWEDLDTKGIYTDKKMFLEYKELCKKLDIPYEQIIEKNNKQAEAQGQTPLMNKYEEESSSEQEMFSAARESLSSLPKIPEDKSKPDPKETAQKILQNLGEVRAGWSALDPKGIYTDHGAFFEKFLFPCHSAGISKDEVRQIVTTYNDQAVAQGRKPLPIYEKANPQDLTLGTRRSPTKEVSSRESRLLNYTK